MKPSSIRSLTKIGMVGSLAVLVLPQLHQSGPGRRGGRGHSLDTHIWAGLALVGFAVWHYNQYQKPEWSQERPPAP